MLHLHTPITFTENQADELRNALDEYLSKHVHAAVDMKWYEDEMRLFHYLSCDPDAFKTYDDYHRFCTTFAPDFFGMD